MELITEGGKTYRVVSFEDVKKTNVISIIPTKRPIVKDVKDERKQIHRKHGPPQPFNLGRECEWCHEPLVPHESESPVNFNTRKTCCLSCSRRATHRRLKQEKDK